MTNDTATATIPGARFLGTSDDVTTCDCCGRTGLKSTVALLIGEALDPVYYGVTCAAHALKSTTKIIRAEVKAADAAIAAAAAAERAAKVAADQARWFSFLNAIAPGHLDWQGKPDVLKQIESLGGCAAARQAYARHLLSGAA